ncbi:MAG: hypothetical protein ACE362_02715 [Phaeodactylibacter xiamenensis]|uniref:Cytochrome oxidase subunit I profile domain-containing protein n=1 Tax=Phaeodactylibacter xiamenensis TaxID=1524460 RepID=A0A098S3X0_9BACT|nr:hypothetical protein [Phaeodactylibacter xiamenensis]KGE85852.1 hypothetical protein IX84_24875 [Phaeodactylibacter xiamenensis]MCR9053911.1 hypothetical protein [bacterium]
MKIRWLRVALLNLFLAAVLGATLRLAFVVELEWMNFRYVLHAHSHVAMLGWAYLGLFALLAHYFLPIEAQQSRWLSVLFWMTQVSVAGMLLTFPVMGYAGPSITFSTLHVLFSYAFVWYFWRKLPVSTAFSHRFVRAAILFMVVSTLALWATAPIILFQLKGSALYYASIQFFLHFQFNGWFLFAILGLFFKYAERRGVALPSKIGGRFFSLLVVSCVLTYALAVAWSNPLPVVYWINSAGVLLQLAAALLFIKLVWPIRKQLSLPGWGGFLIKLAFVCFVGKIAMQSVVAVPVIAEAAYTIRNYVIGFIHLILLGAVTPFLIGFAARQQLLASGILPRIGITLFLIGFAGSKLILFLQGTLFWASIGFMPYYYEGLFAISLLLPIGIGLLLLGQIWLKDGRKLENHQR